MQKRGSRAGPDTDKSRGWGMSSIGDLRTEWTRDNAVCVQSKFRNLGVKCRVYLYRVCNGVCITLTNCPLVRFSSMISISRLWCLHRLLQHFPVAIIQRRLVVFSSLLRPLFGLERPREAGRRSWDTTSYYPQQQRCGCRLSRS